MGYPIDPSELSEELIAAQIAAKLAGKTLYFDDERTRRRFIFRASGDTEWMPANFFPSTWGKRWWIGSNMQPARIRDD